MAGKIPQDFIDELVSRVDIVDVIGSRVPLKKAGREYVACCPFHDEKTPSFSVSPTKQFYHCFGCGAHGTAIGFLMEFERMDFPEAVKELANQVGLELPVIAGGTAYTRRPDDAPNLYEVLEKSARFFRYQLGKHALAKQAIAYLRGRGLSGDIATEFGIGFAPPEWDGLLKAFASTPVKSLVEAGLVIEAEGKRYDRFRNRIMFPIRDRRGRVIAFGGRILDGAEKSASGNGPKYLNSPETSLFHKGKELYGLFEARRALRELPRLLVVEGYMDVVALAQFGIRYATATLGTAVTAQHLEQLFRASPEVVFCFDGDRAGREAAWRGLENALALMQGERQIRFMFLPEGEDPDSLIREIGKEAFEALVGEAMPLSEYLVEQLAQRADLKRVDGQARLVELARPLLSKLPAGIFRQKLLAYLAERARVGETALMQSLGLAPGPRADRPRPRRKGDGEKLSLSPVRRAITLLLQQPSLAAFADNPQALLTLDMPGIRLLVDMLELLHNDPHLTTGVLLEHWRDKEEGRYLSAISQREPLLNEEMDDLAEEFKGAFQRLEQERMQQRRDELSRKSFRDLTGAEKVELQQLLKN